MTQVVILAGGKGTGLGEMTEAIPKPMIPIAGVPFLEILLGHFISQGFDRFLIVLGYLPKYIPSVLGDGAKYGVKITYCGDEENLSLGTGGALKRAVPFLDREFLLIFGDTFLPIDFRDFISTFLNRDLAAMLAVYNNREDTDVIGNIELDSSGLVLKYKKNSSDILNYVDAGAVCLKKKVLNYAPPSRDVSLEEDLYPRIISKRQLYAYVCQDRFYDIGTPNRLCHFKKYYDHYTYSSAH